MENRTYAILTEKITEVEKKLKRIEKKAQKYDVPFSYSFGEPYAIEIKHRDDETGDYYVNKYEVADLTIESEEIKKGDYTVLAHLEHGDNGNIVHTLSGETVAEWVTRKPFCEHCNSNHGLRYTFMVSDGKETKQVGKTCLKDYCGIDPQMIGVFNEFFEDLEEETHYDFPFGFVPCVYDCEEVLAVAIMVQKEQGYIKSDERGSNKHMLRKYLDDRNEPSEDCKALAHEMVEAIKAMSIEEAVEARLSNVKVRVDGGYCKAEEFGYFAYAPLAYEKHLKRMEYNKQKEQKRQQMASTSEYVGEIGKRDVFSVKEFKLITSFPTDYGTTFLYQFIDNNDNVLVWFASSPMMDKEYKDITEVKKIKATVKNHSERDGVKQTIINRVVKVA